MQYEIVSAADYTQVFWKYVNQDPLNYYFFILDWTKNRQDTKILLAIKGGEVGGLALIYADRIVQLRGSREAVDRLLGNISVLSGEIQTPADCADLVQQNYSVIQQAEMILMRVDRGGETILVKHDVEKLLPSDAEEIAETMRQCDPVWWAGIETENTRKSLENNLFYGIRADGKIASFGSAHKNDLSCCNVSVIATHERFRNRGYATSVTSFLVRETLASHQTAIIHVFKSNAPAVKVYSRVGRSRNANQSWFRSGTFRFLSRRCRL